MVKSSSNKLFTLLFLSCLFLFQACSKDNGGVTPPSDNKYLTGVLTERRFSKDEIIKILNAISPGLDIGSTPLAALISDVDVAAISYTTMGVDGKKTEASGVVAMSAGTKSYENLLSIQHITYDLEEAPSLTLFNFEMAPVIMKRVVVMADYLGYGTSKKSKRENPYLHIASTGTACADMIEAAREYLRSKETQEISNKVELMGYSQGGMSTIATVLEMEKRGLSSQITEVHAGGTPYDLAGMLAQFIGAGSTPYPKTGYLPYLIRGMEEGEQMTLAADKVYTSRVISEGFLTMFETKPLTQWHDLLGTDLSKVAHPDFYAPPTYNGNAEVKKVIAALQKNSLISVAAPATPITLYHSKTDDIVPFSYAQAIHAKWGNTKLVELSSTGHQASGFEFILKRMGLWELINK